MKVDILGLLRMATRHLELFNAIQHVLRGEDDDQSQMNKIQEIVNRSEVENAALILEELVENVAIVQKDEGEIADFLKNYCLRKS